MTRVTFLAHSGCLVELPGRCLLFDWWKGALPPLPDKPLLVFASHVHPDHFDPQIFALDDGRRDVTFLLAKDIRLTPRHRERWGVGDGTAARCRSLGGGEHLELPGLAVDTLFSTDEGVAFAVTADGQTVYHAGDLNWWHWEGEPEAANRDMAARFRRYLAPLEGRRIDFAFAPLDPRLEDAYDRGLVWLLSRCDVRRAFPIHLWGQFGLIGRFCAEHPELADRVVPVERDGQSWDFPDGPAV